MDSGPSSQPRRLLTSIYAGAFSSAAPAARGWLLTARGKLGSKITSARRGCSSRKARAGLKHHPSQGPVAHLPELAVGPLLSDHHLLYSPSFRQEFFSETQKDVRTYEEEQGW